MRPLPWWVAGLGLALFVDARATPIEGPHADAPPETSQFAFLIGNWDCATRMMGPDGQFREGHATWSGEWILGGFAIHTSMPCSATAPW